MPRGLKGPVTFPSGGRMLPSFSLLDTNVDGVHSRAQTEAHYNMGALP